MCINDDLSDRFDPGYMMPDGLAFRRSFTPGAPAAPSAFSNVANVVQALEDMDRTDANEMRAKLPSDADVLIAYSTTPGESLWLFSSSFLPFVPCGVITMVLVTLEAMVTLRIAYHMITPIITFIVR